MAHFARLDVNNVVTMVTVVSNEDLLDENGKEVEALGAIVCVRVIGPGPWVQTSYNGKFRKKYAGIGDTYNPELDMFIGVKPYLSWVLDSNGDWQAPVKMPKTGGPYTWNEDTKSWDTVTES